MTDANEIRVVTAGRLLTGYDGAGEAVCQTNAALVPDAGATGA